MVLPAWQCLREEPLSSANTTTDLQRRLRHVGRAFLEPLGAGRQDEKFGLNFFSNYPRWSPEVVDLEQLSDGEIAVGTMGRQVRTEEQLDDVEHAFPRIDDRRTGLANRYGWAVTGRPDEPAITDAATGVVKYDLSDGSSTFHDFGAGRSTSEPIFVPADDAAGEDEGWILSFVYDRADQTSQFVVLDAADMAAEPVATIALPQRVPHGFHGSWIPDEV